ncbi:MAG: hypothetical protein AABW54_00085 [Candidatus Micrarchaeota archaeon]
MAEQGALQRSLARLEKAVANQAVGELKAIGSEMGEYALVRNEIAFAEMGVIAQAVKKVCEKQYLATSPEWPAVRNKVVERVHQAENMLEQARRDEVLECLRLASSALDDFNTNKGRFRTSLASKARIKLAADIYAHGASLGKACELSGAAKQDALEYVSVTKIPDKYPPAISVAERLKIAESVFE